MTLNNKDYIRRDFADLPAALEKSSLTGRKACIVTDKNVADLYLNEVKDLVSTCEADTCGYIVPGDTNTENPEPANALISFLVEHRFGTDDLLVALGGNSVIKTALAACEQDPEGISLILIPTTLFSQICSAGGELIYCNISVLDTLSDVSFANGMAELLKTGLVREADFYEWILGSMGEIGERDKDALFYLVDKCRDIRRIMDDDKKPEIREENGVRSFGHMIGRAFHDLQSDRLNPGDCLNLGMVCAAHISWQRSALDEDDFYEIRDMSVIFDLPISYDSLEPEDILEAVKKDRGMDSETFPFVLLDKIGHAYITNDVTDKEILEALKFIRAE